MNHLSKLMPYVRSGTTEGDGRFLSDVFVSTDQLGDFCAVEPGSMRILVGNKGTGKSAVVEWIHKSSARRQIPSLLLRPDDLVDNGQPASLEMSTLKSHYYEKLLRSVCAQIGSQINAKTPLIGDAARLYNEAKALGLAKDDFVTKSLEMLSAIAVPAGKINGVQFARELAGKNAPAQLVQALSAQLLQHTSKVMYLLIDDTDQIARPTEPEQLNRIWALILSARKLAMLCNYVRPIVTLRSSVWERLIHEDSAQRDQFDHVRPLVVALRATDEHIEQIVERRLVRASGDCFLSTNDPYGNFFEGKRVVLPTSTETRAWSTFIAKSSRERPRDALQLIKSMIEAANDNRHEKIGDKDAEKAMGSYSNERVDDVVAEYSLDCNAIRTVIDSFYSVPFELTFEEIRRHLLTVPSATSIRLRGITMRPNDDADFISLLALLHEFGFVNPRVPDSLARRKFRHLNYSEDSTFVREGNWNNLQAAQWEVHPAFRNHLLAIKDAKNRQRI